MKFSEYIRKFKIWKGFKNNKNTVKGYDLTLRQFGLYVRNKDITKITLSEVMEWFESMVEFGWDHNSLIPKACALKKFFEFYQLQNIKVLNPELIPIPHKEYRLPNIADMVSYKKILATFDNESDPRNLRNSVIVRMLWDTGSRCGELLSLNINDLDLKRMKAVIRTEKAKGKRPFREIFWTRSTNKELKDWLRQRQRLEDQAEKPFDKEALFVSITSHKAGHRFQNKGLGEMLRRRSHEAKLPHILNAHSFRHHMGHDIVKKGGSNSDVSNILGHSSLQSSFVYTQMHDKELEKRYRKFKGKKW